MKGKANLYSLKTISRSLERLQGSLTMVPTQVAFEAVNAAGSHASESDLDAAVTVHAVEKEVRCLTRVTRECTLSAHWHSVAQPLYVRSEVSASLRCF